MGDGNLDGTKEDYHTLRLREVQAREQQAQARMIEASTVSAKAEKETALLAIDETVKLLCARKQLIDKSLCTEENIDECSLMPCKQKQNC